MRKIKTAKEIQTIARPPSRNVGRRLGFVLATGKVVPAAIEYTRCVLSGVFHQQVIS
jgi:hypothetical protein